MNSDEISEMIWTSLKLTSLELIRFDVLVNVAILNYSISNFDSKIDQNNYENPYLMLIKSVKCIDENIIFYQPTIWFVFYQRKKNILEVIDWVLSLYFNFIYF